MAEAEEGGRGIIVSYQLSVVSYQWSEVGNGERAMNRTTTNRRVILLASC